MSAPTAFGDGGVAAAALWWSYFARFGAFVETALRTAGNSQGPVARVVLFAAAAAEIVDHPGEAMGDFTRLLVSLAVGLAMLAQALVVRRVGRPLLVERIAAAIVVVMLMIPEFEVGGNIMLAVEVAVFIGAQVIERQRGRLPQAAA